MIDFWVSEFPPRPSTTFQPPNFRSLLAKNWLGLRNSWGTSGRILSAWISRNSLILGDEHQNCLKSELQKSLSVSDCRAGHYSNTLIPPWAATDGFPYHVSRSPRWMEGWPSHSGRQRWVNSKSCSWGKQNMISPSISHYMNMNPHLQWLNPCNLPWQIAQFSNNWHAFQLKSTFAVA